MKTSREMMDLSSEEKQELLEVMDDHFQIYLRARSLTPYIMKPDVIEPTSTQSGEFLMIPSSPFYQNYGYSCHIIYDVSQFDTDEKYRQYQDIGHWINQSFFIELKCILDSYINWKHSHLADDDHFELLEKCRHLFAHCSYKLDYKPAKGHEKDIVTAKNLYNKIYGHIRNTHRDFNLSIDEFVIPFYLKLVELIKYKL